MTLEQEIQDMVARQFSRDGRRLVCVECGRGPSEGAMLFSAYSDADWRAKYFLGRAMPDHYCAAHAPKEPKNMNKRISKMRALWGDAELNDFTVGEKYGPPAFGAAPVVAKVKHEARKPAARKRVRKAA